MRPYISAIVPILRAIVTSTININKEGIKIVKD